MRRSPLIHFIADGLDKTPIQPSDGPERFRMKLLCREGIAELSGAMTEVERYQRTAFFSAAGRGISFFVSCSTSRKGNATRETTKKKVTMAHGLGTTYTRVTWICTTTILSYSWSSFYFSFPSSFAFHEPLVFSPRRVPRIFLCRYTSVKRMGRKTRA